jgi:hypothetical protein
VLKSSKPLKSKTPLKKTSGKTPTKPKVKTVAQLKKEADKWWSKATRYRFAEQHDGEWYANCITCGAFSLISKLQCGHFISRQYNSTRFVEQNTAPQCLTAESNVEMYGNYKRSIADVIIGDAILAFDDKSYSKTVATVLSKHSFIPDRLYEVGLEDGSKFYATGDHQVVSNGKWVRIDDMLHDVSTQEILEL